MNLIPRRMLASLGSFMAFFFVCYCAKLTYCQMWGSEMAFSGVFDGLAVWGIVAIMFALAFEVWEILIGRNVIGGYMGEDSKSLFQHAEAVLLRIRKDSHDNKPAGNIAGEAGSVRYIGGASLRESPGGRASLGEIPDYRRLRKRDPARPSFHAVGSRKRTV